VATGQLAESRRGSLRLAGTPVFLYHGLTNLAVPECRRLERKYWVSAVHFRDQLAFIRGEGRRVTLLGDLGNFRHASGQEKPPTALTFDDGRVSDYEIAFPLLLEAGIRAEFFVNTANVGTEGYLSWQQMSEMQSRGMSFQSHCHEHVDLGRLPLPEKERQLKLSKQILEDRLGSEVEFLSVPYGGLSRGVVELAIETEYRGVCTSWSWPTQPGARLVSRVVVYAHTTPHGFKNLLSGSSWSYAIRAARAALLFFPKRAVSHFLQPEESTSDMENVT
jgi:peptidoglycan/xylan/chitin deacetylase (PgdA/CDA1 family)